MKNLERFESDFFNEMYIGENGSRVVTCILDDNCVRYVVRVNGKNVSRREYANTSKARCFENATKALNK